MRGETLKGHLDLLLLSVLQHQALHGYGVIQRLHERSGGAFELPEGTVYPALRRLEQAKLVRSRWQTVDGRRRCVYALTTAGKRALATETDSWAAFQAAMTLVLEAPA
jgi:PadR family transcriptional regulator, regulatory protein PadR